jgi:hypothetical protein
MTPSKPPKRTRAKNVNTSANKNSTSIKLPKESKNNNITTKNNMINNKEIENKKEGEKETVSKTTVETTLKEEMKKTNEIASKDENVTTSVAVSEQKEEAGETTETDEATSEIQEVPAVLPEVSFVEADSEVVPSDSKEKEENAIIAKTLAFNQNNPTLTPTNLERRRSISVPIAVLMEAEKEAEKVAPLVKKIELLQNDKENCRKLIKHGFVIKATKAVSYIIKDEADFANFSDSIDCGKRNNTLVKIDSFLYEPVIALISFFFISRTIKFFKGKNYISDLRKFVSRNKNK